MAKSSGKKAPTKRQRVTVSNLYQSVIYCGLLCASLAKQRCKVGDFNFYLELFAEQMLLGSSRDPLVIQPVQIMRLLQSLASVKLVLVEKRATHTYYTLLPAGYMYLMRELVLTPRRLPLEDALYVAHILSTYRPYLLRLATQLDPAGKAELLRLLEPGLILVHQLPLYDQTIEKIVHRQADYARAIAHLRSEPIQKLSLDEQINQLAFGSSIRQTYKTTLREAMMSLPPDLKALELREGFSLRLANVYAPYLRGLQNERQILAGRLAEIVAAERQTGSARP